jgi:hypothetical protein
MLSIARGFLISAALIVVCWWTLQGSPSFQACIQQDNQEAADRQPKEYISRLNARAIAIRDCLGDYVHDRKDEILTVFTVILAFSTIFLWVATRDLVESAEKATRRQLRAYVGIAEAKVENCTPGQILTFTFKVKNYGQTPAHDLNRISAVTIGSARGRRKRKPQGPK